MVDQLRAALEGPGSICIPMNMPIWPSCVAIGVFYNMIRTMWTGGFVALWDFAVAMPAVPAAPRRHRWLLQRAWQIQENARPDMKAENE